MDLDLWGRLGWREGLIAIIGLLIVYIVVLYLRMRRLQHGFAAMPPLAAQSAVAAYSAIQGPAAVAALAVAEPLAPAAPASEPVTAAGALDAQAQTHAAQPAFAWNEPPPEIPGPALIDAMQNELYQLRCEVDELRAEVLAAREDFRQQAAHSTGSPQNASPLYNDAMQMAVQGQDATAIAHHCGIARAEADLVVALARNRREGL